MTDAQRRATPPQDTQDVPDEDVRLMFNGREAVGAPPLANAQRVAFRAPEVRDTQGRLLAPNGQPSNLTEAQWHQVRSPQFKEWWGYDWEAEQGNTRAAGGAGTRRAETGEDLGRDNGLADQSPRGFPSVDANGEPRVFHHGTRDTFSVSDPYHPNKKDVGWLGRGNYVTSDRETAEHYARIKPGPGDPRVMALFARPVNAKEVPPEAKVKGSRLTAKGATRLTETLRQAGHDGAFIDYGEGVIELVVFDDNALKSATDNDGGFSRNSDDIRFSRRQADAEGSLASSLLGRGRAAFDQVARERAAPRTAQELYTQIVGGDAASVSRLDGARSSFVENVLDYTEPVRRWLGTREHPIFEAQGRGVNRTNQRMELKPTPEPRDQDLVPMPCMAPDINLLYLGFSILKQKPLASLSCGRHAWFSANNP